MYYIILEKEQEKEKKNLKMPVTQNANWLKLKMELMDLRTSCASSFKPQGEWNPFSLAQGSYLVNRVFSQAVLAEKFSKPHTSAL